MPPAGHYGDVEKEIGRACVQLASPDFKYMNGETITLEGWNGTETIKHYILFSLSNKTISTKKHRKSIV